MHKNDLLIESYIIILKIEWYCGGYYSHISHYGPRSTHTHSQASSGGTHKSSVTPTTTYDITHSGAVHYPHLSMMIIIK